MKEEPNTERAGLPISGRSRRPGARASRRGVLLIIAAGMLVLLASMAMALYTLMHTQSLAATRHADLARAEQLARAGVEYAHALMRQQAYRQTESPADAWFTADYLNGCTPRISFAELKDGQAQSYSRVLGSSVGALSDRFVLEVEDAAGKVNLNACDNLAVMLDNLCRLIGPPLVAADQDLLAPACWRYHESSYAYGKNPDDTGARRDIYYALDLDGRPFTFAVGPRAGQAKYGDGYAVAGYRSRNGKFRDLTEIKRALTYVERTPGGQCEHALEQMEVEAKFQALAPCLTIRSWADTNTIGVGKFEWAGDGVLVADQQLTYRSRFGSTSQTEKGYCQVLIDRDKSWIADDPEKDPLNRRGSLRGCCVSIVNGHGAGQLRRIATNGADWIAIRAEERMTVAPGPISSYLIISPEDAVLECVAGGPVGAVNRTFPEHLPPPGQVWLPRLDAQGHCEDNPLIDHQQFPLCIHRAPVNINTASDKVLAALFMGLNVQHAHPMAVGTQSDYRKLEPNPLRAGSAWKPQDPDWKIRDPYILNPDSQEPFVLTLRGAKRIPEDSGQLILEKPRPWAGLKDGERRFGYIAGNGALSSLNFVVDGYVAQPHVNEAHELAYRIIVARQLDPAEPGKRYIDPATGHPTAINTYLNRGIFRNWDDLYFRVVGPWDDARLAAGAPNSNQKISVARLIMANANSNADILKFNPNIEWIDRWGRNFVQMETVMSYPDQAAEPDARKRSLPSFNGSWYPKRTLRYRSSDVIDKTDLNRSTAEFSFDSNGVFRIVSNGMVVDPRLGNLLAARKLEALVKVYDVWRESTQAQFVEGTLSPARGKPGSDQSGQVAMDAVNISNRLGLVTQPEPLVPRDYQIRPFAGQGFDYLSQGNLKSWQAYLEDVVSGAQIYDALGQVRPPTRPDVVANRVLPARYDGQILLATNTRDFEPGTTRRDSFLASFDGDLDTGACLGNGREQAKTPASRKVRVMDTIGLLGLLNDTQVDFDPKEPRPPTTLGWKDYNQYGGDYYPRLRPECYWDNATCRMGDLRPDGVFVGNCGLSVKDGGLKYLIADKQYNYANFDPGWGDDNTLSKIPPATCYSLWWKPNWHQNDKLTHEIFNASNPGRGGGGDQTKGFYVYKNTGNEIYSYMESTSDQKRRHAIHGGATSRNVAAPMEWESPSFRTQPFRWSFVGFVTQSPRRSERVTLMSRMGTDGSDAYTGFFTARERGVGNVEMMVSRPHPKGVQDILAAGGAGSYGGELKDAGGRVIYAGDASYGVDTGGGRNVNGDVSPSPDPYPLGLGLMRIFINSQRCPEGPNWMPTYHWSGHPGGAFDYVTNQAKDPPAGWELYHIAAWDWQDGGYPLAIGPGDRQAFRRAVFAINSVNYHNVSPPLHTYRYSPIDGPLAVMDEIKIAKKWYDPRDSDSAIYRDQYTSRYYLPANPADRDQCPSFVSQSLWQSLKGRDDNSTVLVRVVRVSWNAFTPRFMHENKTQACTRTEIVKGAPAPMKFNGPFDYIQYNLDILPDDRSWPTSEARANKNNKNRDVLGVDRPTPDRYRSLGHQPHAATGVEIQLLNDQVPLSNVFQDGKPIADRTFVDPDRINSAGTPEHPAKAPANKLCYKVIFRYPVDPLVDPAAPRVVTPSRHYLLDTPVFDDIAVVYVSQPCLLSFQEINE